MALPRIASDPDSLPGTWEARRGNPCRRFEFNAEARMAAATWSSLRVSSAPPAVLDWLRGRELPVGVALLLLHAARAGLGVGVQEDGDLGVCETATVLLFEGRFRAPYLSVHDAPKR